MLHRCVNVGGKGVLGRNTQRFLRQCGVSKASCALQRAHACALTSTVGGSKHEPVTQIRYSKDGERRDVLQAAKTLTADQFVSLLSPGVRRSVYCQHPFDHQQNVSSGALYVPLQRYPGRIKTSGPGFSN